MDYFLVSVLNDTILDRICIKIPNENCFNVYINSKQVTANSMAL